MDKQVRINPDFKNPKWAGKTGIVIEKGKGSDKGWLTIIIDNTELLFWKTEVQFI